MNVYKLIQIYKCIIYKQTKHMVNSNIEESNAHTQMQKYLAVRSISKKHINKIIKNKRYTIIIL